MGMMKVSTADLLADIEKFVNEHHQLNHPLQQAIIAGKLSEEEHREYIAQRSCIPLYNEAFHGPLYVNCPDPKWRAKIAEVIYEEGTGRLYSNGVSHHELYLRLGEAVGISREEIYNWPLFPEAVAFRATFREACNREFVYGVGAHMLAGEAQSEGYAAAMAAAGMKHYGLSEEAVLFYTVHEEADKDHSDIGRDLLDEFAQTEEAQELVRRGAAEHVLTFEMLHDGIFRRIMDRRG